MLREYDMRNHSVPCTFCKKAKMQKIHHGQQNLDGANHLSELCLWTPLDLICGTDHRIDIEQNSMVTL